LCVTLALSAAPLLRAQDAATEERLNKLSGQIESVIETQQALSKQIDRLAKEIDNVREQAGKPTGNYATHEDLKSLAKAVEEVDRKRVQDAEKIRAELLSIRNALLKSPAAASPRKAVKSAPADTPPSDKPEQGFEYVVQSGDTLSTIAQAYKDKNIKVTVEQIKKANPGLDERKMKVGQKLWIPAPKQ
jgi:LysM repeat protein